MSSFPPSTDSAWSTSSAASAGSWKLPPGAAPGAVSATAWLSASRPVAAPLALAKKARRLTPSRLALVSTCAAARVRARTSAGEGGGGRHSPLVAPSSLIMRPS